MFVATIPVGVFRCNCTVVACELTRRAIVVDPGDEPNQILEIVRRNGLVVTEVVHTHAHLDHIMGSLAVVEVTGAAARLHRGDYPLWENVANIAASYHIPPPRLPPLAEPLEDGEELRFGEATARVIHTPGHTAGSCCFRVDLENGHAMVLSGDTLFRGKIGFACAPFSETDVLVASIRERLFVLADDTRVIPGHGPPTTIGIERFQNAFLQTNHNANRASPNRSSPLQSGGSK